MLMTFINLELNLNSVFKVGHKSWVINWLSIPVYSKHVYRIEFMS